MAKKTDQEKAKEHSAKGDKLLAKGKNDKALKEYKKALDLDSGLSGIYDKLIEAQDGVGGEWKVEDFVDSLSWTMKKQELEHPSIRQIHAKLSPEWNTATDTAVRILNSQNEDEVKKLTETLVSMGEIATRALVGMLVDLKKEILNPKE